MISRSMPLQYEMDAVIPVFAAWGQREAALEAVLTSSAEELPAALAAWRKAESALLDARLAEVTA